MNKILISLIIILSLVFIVCANEDKRYDEKITKPAINLYININENNGIYSLSIDGKECINSKNIKLNTINYEITNITKYKDIKNVNVFTFSVRNSTHQIYKDKEIKLEFTLYGNGYIMNKK